MHSYAAIFRGQMMHALVREQDRRLLEKYQKEDAMKTKLIPNSVGRLDDVLEAIRGDQLIPAIELLKKEAARIEQARSVASKEAARLANAKTEIYDFINTIAAGNDHWKNVRIEAGADLSAVYKEGYALLDQWRRDLDNPFLSDAAKQIAKIHQETLDSITRMTGEISQLRGELKAKAES